MVVVLSPETGTNWGIPNVTSYQSDVAPLTLTRCLRPDMKLPIHDEPYILMYYFIFNVIVYFNNCLCQRKYFDHTFKNRWEKNTSCLAYYNACGCFLYVMSSLQNLGSISNLANCSCPIPWQIYLIFILNNCVSLYKYIY